MNNLPEGYKEWIPRVSNIVSYKFPFAGEGKKRYLEWVYESLKDQVKFDWDCNREKTTKLLKEFPDLNCHNIWYLIQCEETYLTEAQDVGTFIHKQMENYITGEFLDDWDLFQKHHTVIQNWLNYIDQIKRKYTEEDWRRFVAEPVVIDKHKRWQWSCDIAIINEEKKKVVIKDWKTFWIAKKRFGLPNTYRKPYDKIKKWALQFSLYAETYRQKGYEIESIDLVYLHEQGAYEYKLELYSTEDINSLLEKYMTRDSLLPTDISLIFKYNPTMIVEIQTVIPEEAYSRASITLEDTDMKKFSNPEEAIEAGIKLQKYLLAKYK